MCCGVWNRRTHEMVYSSDLDCTNARALSLTCCTLPAWPSVFSKSRYRLKKNFIFLADSCSDVTRSNSERTRLWSPQRSSCAESGALHVCRACLVDVDAPQIDALGIVAQHALKHRAR